MAYRKLFTLITVVFLSLKSFSQSTNGLTCVIDTSKTKKIRIVLVENKSNKSLKSIYGYVVRKDDKLIFLTKRKRRVKGNVFSYEPFNWQ